MPITGLTDRTPSFKELGRLRLGIPKSEALAHGPKEISYFRPDFRPDALDAYTAFVAAYGSQPTSINIRLPFEQIDRCWDAFYEVYNTGGMLGMADGERWLYLRNNKTGELLVRDGIPANAAGLPVDGNGMPYMPFDKAMPVYSYKSKKGEDVAVFARPTGRLKALIPELKRAAYVQVITHSIYNIIHISEQLAGVAAIGKNIGMILPTIPMVLTRRKELISVTFGGRKSMQEKYLLNIEIDPLWMEAQFNCLNAMLPGGPAAKTPALPSGEFTPEDLDESEPSPADNFSEIPAAPAAPAAPPAEPTRPYTPAELKEKFVEWARLYDSQVCGQTHRKKLASYLTAALGDESVRRDFDKWAFGHDSLDDVPDPTILAALKAWMGITGWGDAPDPLAVAEAQTALIEIQRAAAEQPEPEGEI